MNSYTKHVNVYFLIRLLFVVLFGNGYAYAQSTASNVCPATTVDLTTHVSGTPASGTLITWHTGTPATAVNRVANPNKVGAGIYYAAYFDVATSCYGNTTGSLTVTINVCQPINNICPATTVDLTAHVLGTPASGTLITWHTGTPASLANRIADPTQVTGGLYYVAYFDVATSSYGNTSGPVSVSIVLCPAPVSNTGTVVGGIGGTAVSNVTTNDLMGSQPVTLGIGGNGTIASVGAYPVGITLNTATGAIIVSPSAALGTYTLVYQLCNTATTSTCATTTAQITVMGTAPAATPDIALTQPGKPVSGNVLTNDSDPQGLPLATSIVSQPTAGTVTLSPTGSYTYTPPTGFTGVVSFCYSASATTGLSASTCVTVTVVPDPVLGNNRPVVTNDNTQTIVGVPVTVAVLANDSDPDSATSLSGQLAAPTLLSQPSVGTSVVNGNGTVTYTPPANFTGLVTFPYQVCDQASPALCTTAVVSVTVQPTPPVGTTLSPVAVDDVLLTKINTPVTGNVSTNDSDPNSLTLTYTSGQPSSGTVVMSATGSYTYTPAPGYTGPVSFTYTVCNTAGRCDVATVTGLVQPNPLLISLLPKVYLQGTLIGVFTPNTLMRDDLRVAGYLPTNHPYATRTPITSVGPLTASVTAVTGADAIVDWVFVELRSPTSASAVIDSRAALLQRDGDIVDVDGVSALRFSVSPPGSYYVAVRHRNHLAVMSQTAVPLSSTTTVIDFRQPATPTYTYTGTSSYSQMTTDQAQVIVDQGVAMWAGNVLRDNEAVSPHNYVIFQGNNNDVNSIYQQVVNPPGVLTTSFTIRKGYMDGDVNMDGKVIFQGTKNDVELIYQNIIKNHPGNQLNLPFFKIREQLP